MQSISVCALLCKPTTVATLFDSGTCYLQYLMEATFGSLSLAAFSRTNNICKGCECTLRDCNQAIATLEGNYTSHCVFPLDSALCLNATRLAMIA